MKSDRFSDPREYVAWTERYNRFADMYANETDRGAAVLCAGLVDEFLAAVLGELLVDDAPFQRRVLENGCLSSYSARREVLYGLGLLSSSVASDLVNIGRIRNKFAHSPDVTSFESEVIANLCSQLSTASPAFLNGNVPSTFATPRDQYLVAAAMAIMKLHFMLVQHRRPVVPDDEDWTEGLEGWLARQL